MFALLFAGYRYEICFVDNVLMYRIVAVLVLVSI